jgi:beta-glucosidase-like glycosyl hydrolase
MCNKFIFLICVWIFSLPLSAMTLEEKIAQLIIAAGQANDQPEELERLKRLVQEQKVGGVIWMMGEPNCQVRWITQLQQLSATPLLMAQDAEYGMTMRLSAGLRLPRAMTLGALTDKQLIYEMGREVGRQCHTLGIALNFAPVADVNNNPRNPVIHEKSFGDDPEAVAEKAVLYMQGLEAAGVISCGKHFPGHGDTHQDSHATLPMMAHSLDRLRQVELVPFRALVAAQIPMIMVGHLAMHNIDPLESHPATLSPIVIEELLRSELGFKGIVITDALNMRALGNIPLGELEVQALLAGNDMLLMPVDVPLAITAIREAVESGRLTEERIDHSLRKVLALKKQFPFHQPLPFELANFMTAEALQLKKRLFSEAVTLVRHPDGSIPLTQTAAILTSNAGSRTTVFSSYLACINCFDMGALESYENFPTLLQALDKDAVVIVAVYGTTRNHQNAYDLTPQLRAWIPPLVDAGKQVIVVHFGTPYAIKYLNKAQVVIAAYEDDPDAQIAAAEVLLGKRLPKGVLPVQYSSDRRQE